MKKRILAITLATVMSVSMLTGCSAEGSKTDNQVNKVATNSEYQYVSPKDAVSAAQKNEVHILDVREWSNYVAGRMVNSKWSPIFPLEDETLVTSMTEYAEKNLKDGNKIYLVCNSGKRGAEKATKVLTDAGIDKSLIFTVEGGAKALADEKDGLLTNRVDEAIEWQYVSGADALAAFGKGEAQIVDVRDDDTYKEGHIADSLQVGLKEIESADAQTKAFELAAGMDKDKPVYFLCYSGNKCAKTGISVFKDAGFDESNLYIIQDGAKGEDISNAFVK